MRSKLLGLVLVQPRQNWPEGVRNEETHRIDSRRKPQQSVHSLLGDGITWGFTLGDIKTRSVLRINEEGEWTELAEIDIGSQPARKFMELRVTH